MLKPAPASKGLTRTTLRSGGPHPQMLEVSSPLRHIMRKLCEQHLQREPLAEGRRTLWFDVHDIPDSGLFTLFEQLRAHGIAYGYTCDARKLERARREQPLLA